MSPRNTRSLEYTASHTRTDQQLTFVPALGGTTPTLAELTALLSALESLPGAESEGKPARPAIRIMIRPRGPPSPATSSSLPADESEPSPARIPDPEDKAHQLGRQQHQHTAQDFIYTPAELNAMAAAISQFASSGLLRPELGDGFVFGVLKPKHTTTTTTANFTTSITSTTPSSSTTSGDPPTTPWADLELDVQQNRRLAERARPFACVLHRAVDDLLLPIHSPESSSSSSSSLPPLCALALLRRAAAECGFDGVLTSGGKGRAAENVECLRAVVAAAADITGGGGGFSAGESGERRGGVEVIIGGGVRSGNLRALVDGLGEDVARGDGVWWHSSCLAVGEDGEERFDPEEARRLVDGLRELGFAGPGAGGR